MQRNTGYFPTESLEPSGNRLFSRSALNEGYLFRGSLGFVQCAYFGMQRRERLVACLLSACAPDSYRSLQQDV